MALLLGCQRLAKAYGAAPLFADVSFGIHDGDHIGLVGPNGSGKSTLLRLLAGLETPDAGTVALRRLTRLGYVPQHPEFAPNRTLADVLADALHDEPLDEAARHTRLKTTLGRAGFADPDATPAALSGGWQKRLAIARALVRAPDLLLMDEPTNHLDLDGILWLEQLLRTETAAFLVVSHDRWFLEHVTGRMLDLDPVHTGGLFETRGRYSEFLERKDAALREQARWQETLANRVRREVDWLRHGPKARTTKSQARIAEAGRLIDELAEVDARHAARRARPERQRQVDPHPAPHRRARPRRRPRRARRRSPGSRPRPASIPPRSLGDAPPRARAARRPGAVRRTARARRRLGATVPVRAGAAHPARRPPLGRRAGSRPDRHPDAATGRPPRARRADERPRHPDPGGVRGGPARVPRRRRPGDARPVPLRARRDHGAGTGRPRGRDPVRRLPSMGSRTMRANGHGGKAGAVIYAGGREGPGEAAHLGGAARMGGDGGRDRRRGGDADALSRSRARPGHRDPRRRARRALPRAPGRPRSGRSALRPLGRAGGQARLATRPGPQASRVTITTIGT